MSSRSSRSLHGGRHELGQNFLHHRPTIDLILELVRRTEGPLLELGAGDGALTVPLSRLGRPLTAVELDEHRAARLARRLPEVRVLQRDALRVRLDAETIVGNVPFHLTTPILRRLLEHGGPPRSAHATSRDQGSQRSGDRPRGDDRRHGDGWRDALLLVQWEVARKRAGVGGGTLMGALAAPWFEFALHGRVPASGFRPMPSVDGGVLSIHRRESPLLPASERRGYEAFVRAAFTGRGRGLAQILGRVSDRQHAGTGGTSRPPGAPHDRTREPARPGARPREAGPREPAQVRTALRAAGIGPQALPRDLAPAQWVMLWQRLS
ncbi:ribosomal RNA small subunit methyltransferase A [Sediminivirga luteola]|uniref:ribosomal RNA small subunit methyltransferase A n=1 Tax=Sediminivirga luteola TaxID=1774748 RepID=UPI001F56ACB4|nr:rRNA adenine N(6)-methyltransferase family protein [Sediminivirga luteola]MCI2265551.1 23S ribosomal RNA methyltransferase Erm [Sediminivirga luteola]